MHCATWYLILIEQIFHRKEGRGTREIIIADRLTK